MVLSKNASLFARDENGDLIPQEVELIIDDTDVNQVQYKGEKISIVPVTRGELRKLFSLPNLKETSDQEEADLDSIIIEKFCKLPKFTKEEITYIRPGLAPTIVNTILHHSGLDVRKSRAKALEDKEEEFVKNSEGLGQIEKKAI